MNHEIDIPEDDLFLGKYKFDTIGVIWVFIKYSDKQTIEEGNTTVEKIPTALKFLFSLPAFGKMSCLLIMK
jgi:hypothetical protein